MYLKSNATPNYVTQAANKENLKGFSYRTESFKYSFFLVCVRKWNNLGNFIREAKTIKKFKSMLMQFFTLTIQHMTT